MFSDAIVILKSHIDNSEIDKLDSQLSALIIYIRYGWGIIENKHIISLNSWVNDCLNGKNELGKIMAISHYTYKNILSKMNTLHRQLNKIMTHSLIKNIHDNFNLEINEDTIRIKDELGRFGFPKDLSESLDKIDNLFNVATDDFDFNGCMDKLRSFTERLYSSISISLDNTEGRKINGMDSEATAKFFIQKGLVSENQAKLITSLRHFLSNVGSHRLKSRPEDARLSRGMTIELSLYLILRLRSRQSE